MRMVASVAACIAVAAVGCDGGSDLTAPDQPPAARIVIIGGDAQTAAAGSRLHDSLIVRVTDSKDRPVRGQRVGFAASAGTVTPAAVTGADGRTGAGWVLGPVAGPQTATATATGNGAPPGLAVTFRATATASTPAKLEKIAGEGQTAPAGSAVATPPAVKVTDAGGNPVAGVDVAFAVTTGGGSVIPTSAVSTDATGVAAATSWTLGTVAGTNTLAATITGSGITGNPATFTATGTAVPTVATDLGPFLTGSGCPPWPGVNAFYYSAAYDANNDGVIVGETGCVAGEPLTFRWSQATGMQQLANYPGGYSIIAGRSINNAGYIAAAFNPNGTQAYWSPIVWTLGNARIDLAPGTAGAASEINDKNEVVGVFATGAWRWSAATGIVALPALGDRTPVAINSQGDIAAAGTAPPPALGGTAILSETGALTLIDGVQAEAMNDQRVVVGATGTWPAANAALWSQSTGIVNLGTLGGTTSWAYGINDAGEVVGSSTTGSGAVHAFYWTASRGMVDLGPGVAYAISDAGHMVGMAPSGLFPPEMAPDELWQATLWRGTGGVATAGPTARAAAAPSGRAAACFNDAANWPSKTRMLRCMAGRP